MSGVPKGYVHHWTYRGRWTEKKIGPGRWKVTFKATKNKHSGKGGPGVGTKIRWGFRNVRQRAVKTANGRYETLLTGEKYLINAAIRKRGRYGRR